MIHVIVHQFVVLKEDSQLIERMMKCAQVDEYIVTNVRNYPVPIVDGIYLSFGNKAAFAIEMAVPDATIVKLPELGKLFDKLENKSTRAEAMKQLDALRSTVELDKVPPSLDKKWLPRTSIEMLVTLLDVKKQEWPTPTGVTLIARNGKIIRVVINQSDKSDVLIKISIEELIAIKLACEVFDIEGFVHPKEKS